MTTITREVLDANMEAVALYRGGHSILAIAMCQGRGNDTITQTLKRYGVTIRQPGRPAKRGAVPTDGVVLSSEQRRNRITGHHCARCYILVQEEDWFCEECHAELARGDAWDPGAEWDASEAAA